MPKNRSPRSFSSVHFFGFPACCVRSFLVVDESALKPSSQQPFQLPSSSSPIPRQTFSTGMPICFPQRRCAKALPFFGHFSTECPSVSRMAAHAQAPRRFWITAVLALTMFFAANRRAHVPRSINPIQSAQRLFLLRQMRVLRIPLRIARVTHVSGGSQPTINSNWQRTTWRGPVSISTGFFFSQFSSIPGQLLLDGYGVLIK